jgi:signal transduction histidine kinase
VAVVHADPGKAELAAEYQRLYPPDPRSAEAAPGVIRTGRAVLLAEISDEALMRFARDEVHLAMLRELGFASGIVVPLRIDDRVTGAVTLIAAESRRRFGAHELRLAEMLAEWAALSVDKARAYEVATEASRTRDEVLSVVSHDLRNPIGTILTSAAFIPDLAPDLPAPVLRQLGIIRRQAEAANRLIQDLLDVSRIEGGRLPLDVAPLAPRLLLQEAMETLRPLAAPRGLRLLCETGDGLPEVCADRDRLLQAFGNLVGNALRYTPEGGAVTLRADACEGEVCFSVTDTGEGIRAEDLPHLFDRFYQARQKRRGGAGLGLAIVKGIVESHGGRIWVDSTPGQGTTFTFAVPAVPAAGG